MSAWAVDYVLGAVVRIVVDAVDEREAVTLAASLVDERVAAAGDLVAYLDVDLIGPPDVAEVERVTW